MAEARSFRFARHMGWNALGQLAGAAANLLSIPFLVSRLGLEAYGLVVILQALAGYLMLASLGLSGVRDLAQASGLKNLLAAAIKGAAVVYLALGGAVVWGVAAVMAIGALAGGWAGAGVAQRLSPRALRAAVLVLGALMTIATFAGVS